MEKVTQTRTRTDFENNKSSEVYENNGEDDENEVSGEVEENGDDEENKIPTCQNSDKII